MKAEETPLFQIDPFDYVLWVDPNNIAQQLKIFQLYLGANKIKHFKSMEQTESFLKNNSQFRHFLVVSGKVYKENSKTMDEFLSTTINIYNKIIIFCFDKGPFLKYKNITHVLAVENEDIKVAEILSQRARKVRNKYNPQLSKIRIVYLDLKQHQATRDLFSYLSKYFWQGMKINIFNSQNESDGLNQLEDARQLYHVLSFPEHIKYKDIINNYLSTYQGIIGWYLLIDKYNVKLLPESEDQEEFIDDIFMAAFFKGVQLSIIKS